MRIKARNGRRGWSTTELVYWKLVDLLMFFCYTYMKYANTNDIHMYIPRMQYHYLKPLLGLRKTQRCSQCNPHVSGANNIWVHTSAWFRLHTVHRHHDEDCWTVAIGLPISKIVVFQHQDLYTHFRVYSECSFINVIITVIIYNRSGNIILWKQSTASSTMTVNRRART